MPLPISFVVKNGSKILSFTSGGMPWPESSTSIATYSAAGSAPSSKSAHSAGVTLRVRRMISPPSGIASRALTMRLTTTCSNWLRSALTSQRSRPCRNSRSIFLADEAAHHHLQVGEHVAELQNLRAQGLAARKGEQLPHQTGGAVGVLLDLHDVAEGRIGRPVIGEQQVRIADDRGQHIVEIMRDAAGELADRLHFLRLREILLQRALLGRVERKERRARSVALVRTREMNRRAERSPSPASVTSSGAASACDPGRRQRGPQRVAIALQNAGNRSSGSAPSPGFKAAGISRAKAAFQRRTRPSASSMAMAIGVALKTRANRASARGSPAASWPASSTGARSQHESRRGPSATSSPEAAPTSRRAGSLLAVAPPQLEIDFLGACRARAAGGAAAGNAAHPSTMRSARRTPPEPTLAGS